MRLDHLLSKDKFGTGRPRRSGVDVLRSVLKVHLQAATPFFVTFKLVL